MAALLKLRQAARLIGVSPGRLYRAIADGRLAAAPGGGPGKPTLVSWEVLQTFCQSEGLHLPDAAKLSERSERLERSRDDGAFQEELTQQLQQAFDTLAAQYLVRVVEHQSAYIDAFLQDELTHLVQRLLEGVMNQVVERLTAHLERSERHERPERSRPATAPRRLPPSAAQSKTASPPATKATVLQRLRAMQAEGLSLQAMANRLNSEGMPTLSGKGQWQKGTIGKWLAQGEERPYLKVETEQRQAEEQRIDQEREK
jgi:Recombinase